MVITEWVVWGHFEEFFKMTSSLDELLNAEFKEAFDEFDKVCMDKV